MNNNEPQDGNTELVLPIICPNCKHEVNLNMLFSLLPPEEANTVIKSHVTSQEEA